MKINKWQSLNRNPPALEGLISEPLSELQPHFDLAGSAGWLLPSREQAAHAVVETPPAGVEQLPFSRRFDVVYLGLPTKNITSVVRNRIGLLLQKCPDSGKSFEIIQQKLSTTSVLKHFFDCQDLNVFPTIFLITKSFFGPKIAFLDSCTHKIIMFFPPQCWHFFL